DFLSKGTPLQALFSQYHRKFQKIVKWLADNGKMEQSSEKEKFQRGIPSTLWVRIGQRLEILYLLHHPDDPYKVDEMFNTGDWYLKGNTTAMASVPPTGRQGGILPAPSPQSATVPVNVKTTNTSGADRKCRKNRDNKVVLPSGSYIPQYPEKASSSQQKEPKVAKEKLPPKDKGKKLMKPTVEEVPEEALPPIHLYSGIPEDLNH
ncbi:hypothetical protein C0995_015243, partial [Termitomyces sp. Mi166